MIRTAVLIACVSFSFPALARAATPLSFLGAQMGMTVGEWRSLGPPEGAGPDALPACSSDPRIEAVSASNPLSATKASSAVVTCSYVSQFGDWILTHSVKLDAHYRASDIKYLFDQGRLAEIRFAAPIDAFSDVMAMLKGECGPPTATQRDQIRTADGRFARVTQTWRVAGGTIKLVDPADGLTQLEVSMVGPDAAAAAIQNVASGGVTPVR